jgi:hypothetical protein
VTREEAGGVAVATATQGDDAIQKGGVASCHLWVGVFVGGWGGGRHGDV